MYVHKSIFSNVCTDHNSLFEAKYAKKALLRVYQSNTKAVRSKDRKGVQCNFHKNLSVFLIKNSHFLSSL